MDRTARVWGSGECGPRHFGRRRFQAFRCGTFVADGLLIADADGQGDHCRTPPRGDSCETCRPSTSVRSIAWRSRPPPTDCGRSGRSQADASYVALSDLDAGEELARCRERPTARLPETSGTGPVGAFAFSPDGKYLVARFGGRIGYPARATNFSCPLKVSKIASRPHPPPRWTAFCCSLLDFSRDGKLLASGATTAGRFLVHQYLESAQTLQSPFCFCPQHGLLAGRQDAGRG